MAGLSCTRRWNFRLTLYIFPFVLSLICCWFIRNALQRHDSLIKRHLVVDIQQGIFLLESSDNDSHWVHGLRSEPLAEISVTGDKAGENHEKGAETLQHMPAEYEEELGSNLKVLDGEHAASDKTYIPLSGKQPSSSVSQQTMKPSLEESIPNRSKPVSATHTLEQMNLDQPFIISYCKKDWAANAIIELSKHIALPNVQALEDPSEAHIGFYSAWGRCKHQSKARLRVFIDMEPKSHHKPRNPVITTLRLEAGQESKNSIWVPYGFFHFPQRGACCQPGDLLIPKLYNSDAQRRIMKSKTKFAVFLARHCGYGKGVMQRTKLFDALSKEYKKVDSLSRCRKNAKPPKRVPAIYKSERDKPVAWFKPYKFAIVFENTRARGYCTEKLMNAVLANTVPIYWGPPDIAEMINVNAIVHCEPGKNNSFRACIQEVRKLDNDDRLYLEKLAQPLFKNNVFPDWMRWDPVVERIMDLYREAARNAKKRANKK